MVIKVQSVKLSRRAFLLGLGSFPLAAAVPQFVVPAEASAGAALSAVKTALQGDFDGAARIARDSGNRPAIKLVELLYLKDKEEKAGFSRIAKFLSDSPNWPLSETLAKKAEIALFEEGRPTSDALNFFAARDPLTPEGNAALADAHFKSGRDAEGRKHLLRAWFDADLGAANEKKLLARHGGKLSQKDQANRMWRLILAQSPLSAIRNAKRLGGNYPAAAEAAHYLLGGAAGAESKYNALPTSMREAAALKYALARFYRRLEKFSKARAVLASVPGDASVMLDPDAFWTERRIIARRSLGPRQKANYRSGYQIASRHGAASGDTALEGEHLAGWIALRYLNDADAALGHFGKLAKLAVTRTDKSRAAYWTGRAYTAKKMASKARESFTQAAKFSTLYYGQLAREHVGLAKTPGNITTGKASQAAIERVGRDEVVQALRLIETANGQQHVNMFLWSLAKRFETVEEMNAAASLISEMSDVTTTLRFAKAAAQQGIDIDSWAYPVRAMPDWKQVGRPVEKALVFGLSRQESEFNPTAGSTAGAQGLMQLMPGTARLVAKRYGLPYAVSRLKSDPAYNVKLGAAHLSELIDDYRGSYVLTLVAYNAGPRRVNEWIEQFGDPRSGSIDAIDWVESIPFQETRQYVQKVLQNVQVYRARLNADIKPLSADLRRGAAAGLTVASTGQAPDAPCGGSSIGDLATRCD
jgi:soluble lytic murein transglycosylase